VAEVVLQVFTRRSELRGLRMTYEAPFLRHFTARFEMV
jgi:tryptophanase